MKSPTALAWTTLKRPALSLLIAALLCTTFCSTKANADPLRIMAVGDSITAGYTDNRDGWTDPFGFGYRSGLYTLLTDAEYDFQFVGTSPEPWSGTSSPLPPVVQEPDLRPLGQDNHRGYGGIGTSYVASNIGSWVTADDPDVILLMIGINSISQGSTGHPTSVESSLNNLVQTVVSTKPDAHLIVAQITPYAGYTDAIVQYNDYIANTLIPSYVSQGKNVSTVDQYSNLLTGGVIDPSKFSNGINHPDTPTYAAMAQTWFDGIESLDLGTPVDPIQPSMVKNGGFETPAYSDPHHDYAGGIAGSGWTPTGRAGIDRGNPYGTGVLNCTPAEGAQMGFLSGDLDNIYTPAPDGVTSLSRDVSGFVTGETYTLKFDGKGMQGFSGVNPFRVSLNGTDLTFSGVGLLKPNQTYDHFISDPIVAAAETMNLKFYDEGYVPGGQVSWVDDVRIAAGAETYLSKFSFEEPVYENNSHNYPEGIAGSGWTPTGRAGIERGNPYYGSVSNCTPYEGSQMAFIQGDFENIHTPAPDGVTSLSRDITGLEVGKSYSIKFEAKAMAGYSGVNPFRVSLGGTELTFGGVDLLVPFTQYSHFISDAITATGDTLTLKFYDEGNVVGQKVSWIDYVRVTEAEENLVANGGFETPVLEGANVHDYRDITGTQWTHAGRSGIGRGNAFGSAAPNCRPAEGSQMAFLQGDEENPDNPHDQAPDGVTRLSQDVSGFEIGAEYILSFEAMGMDGYDGVNPFNVSIDGTDLFGLIVPSLEYEEYVSDPFTATAETMNLMFYDQGYADMNTVSWIDYIRITKESVNLPGDFNLDGSVDVTDLGILATNYGILENMQLADGDANGDGAVDVSDLGILATNYGTTAAALAAIVPEPASTTLLVLGTLGILFVRRRA